MIAPNKPESWQLRDTRNEQQTCGAAASAWVCVGLCVLAAILAVLEALR